MTPLLKHNPNKYVLGSVTYFLLKNVSWLCILFLILGGLKLSGLTKETK